MYLILYTIRMYAGVLESVSNLTVVINSINDLLIPFFTLEGIPSRCYNVTIICTNGEIETMSVKADTTIPCCTTPVTVFLNKFTVIVVP